MCWSSKNKPVRQLAKEDIPVFKLCFRSSDTIILPYHYSGRLTYMVGGTYSSDIHMKKCLMGWETFYDIDEALHSYSPKCVLRPIDQWKVDVYTPDNKSMGYYQTDRLCVVLCIIPKGGTFYLNENGEYASDTIKVVKAIDYPKVSYIYNHTDVNNKTVSVDGVLNKWIYKKIEV